MISFRSASSCSSGRSSDNIIFEKISCISPFRFREQMGSDTYRSRGWNFAIPEASCHSFAHFPSFSLPLSFSPIRIADATSSLGGIHLKENYPDDVGAGECEWVQTRYRSVGIIERRLFSGRGQSVLSRPSFYRVAITEPPVALCGSPIAGSLSFGSCSSFQHFALFALGAFDTRAREYSEFLAICSERDINRNWKYNSCLEKAPVYKPMNFMCTFCPPPSPPLLLLLLLPSGRTYRSAYEFIFAVSVTLWALEMNDKRCALQKRLMKINSNVSPFLYRCDCVKTKRKESVKDKRNIIPPAKGRVSLDHPGYIAISYAIVLRFDYIPSVYFAVVLRSRCCCADIRILFLVFSN